MIYVWSAISVRTSISAERLQNLIAKLTECLVMRLKETLACSVHLGRHCASSNTQETSRRNRYDDKGNIMNHIMGSSLFTLQAQSSSPMQFRP